MSGERLAGRPLLDSKRPDARHSQRLERRRLDGADEHGVRALLSERRERSRPAVPGRVVSLGARAGADGARFGVDEEEERR